MAEADKAFINFHKNESLRDLPDDLKALPREETVCKFCGVSYLIHHEIKALQERVKELESYETKWKESFDIQINLKSKISKLEMKLMNLQKELTQSQEWLSERDKQVICMKDENDTLQENLSLKNRDLSTVKMEANELAKDYSELRERQRAVSHSASLVSRASLGQDWQMCVQDISSSLEHFSASMAACTSRVVSQVEVWRRGCDNRRAEMERNTLKAELKVDELRREVQLCKDELLRNQSTADGHSKELQQELVKSNSKLQSLNEQVKSQSFKISELTSELNRCRKTHLQEKQDLSTKYNCLQKESANKCREKEELIATLENLKGELESVRRGAVKDKQSFDEECFQLTAKIKGLQKSLKTEQVERVTLKEELNKKQAQLDQQEHDHTEETSLLRCKLKESEEERLSSSATSQKHIATLKADIAQWQSKYKEDLKAKEEEFNLKIKEMETKLYLKHKMEMEEMKSLHTSETEHLNNDHQYSLLKQKEQLETYINELRAALRDTSNHVSGNNLMNLKEQLEKERLSNEAEMVAHIREVKDLELSLKEKEEERELDRQQHRAELEKMKQEIDQQKFDFTQLMGRLQEKDAVIAQQAKELQEAKEEVNHLQETVQHECEERLELKEALTEMKEQFHSYKKSVAVPRVPSSQSHSRPLTPKDSLEESRQRIASATGRTSSRKLQSRNGFPLI